MSEVVERFQWTEAQAKVFERLQWGVRDQSDPVTFRTFMVNSMTLLGVENPEKETVSVEKAAQAEALLDLLLADSWLQELKPELAQEMGLTLFSQSELHSLDILLVNGRHKAEPLLYTLAQHAEGAGKRVAVVNPVGHYNDEETRIVFPTMQRDIDHLVVVASTQAQQGGSFEVLTKVMRILRNPELAEQVKTVDVVVPMWGGSRGHKVGQRFGFEVLEAKTNPKLLAVTTRNIVDALVVEEHITPPKIRFLTVDVHHEISLREVFDEEGFDFINVNAMPELSRGVVELARDFEYPSQFTVVACDAGAVPRSRCMADGILEARADLDYVDLAYMLKIRQGAGIKQAWIDRVERYWRDGRRESAPQEAFAQETTVVPTDDMYDTGGTARTDVAVIRNTFPQSKIVFAATHPVLSKGAMVLERGGADRYVFANTLQRDDLNRTDVRLVDVAPAILRAIR